MRRSLPSIWQLKFEKTVRASPRLGFGLYFLSEDMHNMIEACVRDQAD